MKTKSWSVRKLLLCVTPLAALVASFASPRPAQASFQDCYYWCNLQYAISMHWCEVDANGGEVDSLMFCLDEAFSSYLWCMDSCSGYGGPVCDPIADAFCVPQDETF